MRCGVSTSGWWKSSTPSQRPHGQCRETVGGLQPPRHRQRLIGRHRGPLSGCAGAVGLDAARHANPLERGGSAIKPAWMDYRSRRDSGKGDFDRRERKADRSRSPAAATRGRRRGADSSAGSSTCSTCQSSRSTVAPLPRKWTTATNWSRLPRRITRPSIPVERAGQDPDPGADGDDRLGRRRPGPRRASGGSGGGRGPSPSWSATSITPDQPVALQRLDPLALVAQQEQVAGEQRAGPTGSSAPGASGPRGRPGAGSRRPLRTRRSRAVGLLLAGLGVQAPPPRVPAIAPRRSQPRQRSAGRGRARRGGSASRDPGGSRSDTAGVRRATASSTTLAGRPWPRQASSASGRSRCVTVAGSAPGRRPRTFGDDQDRSRRDSSR